MSPCMRCKAFHPKFWLVKSWLSKNLIRKEYQTALGEIKDSFALMNDFGSFFFFEHESHGQHLNKISVNI